jgi:hypothetical protein
LQPLCPERQLGNSSFVSPLFLLQFSQFLMTAFKHIPGLGQRFFLFRQAGYCLGQLALFILKMTQFLHLTEALPAGCFIIAQGGGLPLYFL